MATARPVVSARQASIRAETMAIENEITELKKKLAVAETALRDLERERDVASEKIAAGEKADIVGIANRITVAQAGIAGLSSLIARKQPKLDGLYPELRRIEAADLHAARQAAVEKLRAKLATVDVRINANLRTLMTEDLREHFDTIDELASPELRDAGGPEAIVESSARLFTPDGRFVLDHELTDVAKAIAEDRHPFQPCGGVFPPLRGLRPPKH